jgi:predicted ATPase
MLSEDAHWSDLSTLELLNALIDRTQSLSVLSLITYRPEFRPPWMNYGHVTTHSLNRLGWREVGGIVDRVTGGKTLPPEVLEQIIAKTDGVPLFIEELTKTVVEAGILTKHEQSYSLDGPLPPLTIPSTLHDALIEGTARPLV